MNSARINLFLLLLALTPCTYAGEGRNLSERMPGQTDYPAQKPPKLASKAENLTKDVKHNKIGLNQTASNSTEPATPPIKKQLSKEERLALRRQINQVGGYYPNKN